MTDVENPLILPTIGGGVDHEGQNPVTCDAVEITISRSGLRAPDTDVLVFPLHRSLIPCSADIKSQTEAVDDRPGGDVAAKGKRPVQVIWVSKNVVLLLLGVSAMPLPE